MTENSNLPDTAVVSFVECVTKGSWEVKYPEIESNSIWKKYRATGGDNQSEIWLVRPDGLRRAWIFKNNSDVYIGESAVRFRFFDVSEEIAVDEEKQSGKPSKPTVF